MVVQSRSIVSSVQVRSDPRESEKSNSPPFTSAYHPITLAHRILRSQHSRRTDDDRNQKLYFSAN